jgi:hypothetical protein
MKGAIFNSNNKYGDLFQYETTGSSVYVQTTFADVTGDRVLVGISGLSTSYSGGNIYSYTGLTPGTTKIVQIKTSKTSELGVASFFNPTGAVGGGITKTLDFTKWKKMETSFIVQSSPSLSGITMPAGWLGNTSTSYVLNSAFNIINTGLKSLDLSQMKRIQDYDIFNNPSLTAITFANNGANFYPRYHRIYSNNLQGNLDLTPITSTQNRYNFVFYNNPGLTGVTFPYIPPKNTGSASLPLIYGFNCNITGHLNMGMVVGFPTYISFASNNITGVTFPSYSVMTASTNTIVLSGCGYFEFQSNDLQGNLDVSMFKRFYNNFRVDDNSLTGITFNCLSACTFNEFRLNNNNLIGNLNLSTITGRLGGTFDISINPNLTGITFSSSGNTHLSAGTTQFLVNNCNLTGVLDISKVSGLTNYFAASANSNLTQILHGPSNNLISFYFVSNCNLTGTHDMSMLTKLGGIIRLYFNPNLTNIIFPPSTQNFFNIDTGIGDSAFSLYNCNLDYIDFKPLSGATLNNSARIQLQNNAMTAADVNHILVDFVTIATSNPTGWDSIVLNIGGTNANPDTTSGGYDGLAAIATLTGLPYNWTITY